MKISEILDLTTEIYHNYPGNPVLPPTRLDLTHNFASDGCRLERLDTPTHAGTHVDAPAHMLENGATLSEVPLDQFLGWATAVDLREKGAGASIGPADLAGVQRRIAGCDFVILYTGWGDKLGFTKEYVFSSPWLSREGAEWLIERGIRGVGIDHMSVSGMEEKYDIPTHEALLGAGVLIIEGLALTPRVLERKRWYLLALPLRIKGASGAPARVLALHLEE